MPKKKKSKVVKKKVMTKKVITKKVITKKAVKKVVKKKSGSIIEGIIIKVVKALRSGKTTKEIHAMLEATCKSIVAAKQTAYIVRKTYLVINS